MSIQPSTSDLTGVWQCDDGGLYYIRQAADGTVAWAGLQDSGFHKGLEFTNVFRGRLSADGYSIAGEWADVPRGGTANSGTIAVGIWSFADGPRLLRVDDETTGGFGGSTWHATGSLLEPQNIADVQGRVQRYDVKLGHNNPPCRDFTVMWGSLWDIEPPTLPPYFPESYCAFVGWVESAAGPTWLPWSGDGDFTFNIDVKWDTEMPNCTSITDFWNPDGWLAVQPPEMSEPPLQTIARLWDKWLRFHCETAMYGRENSGWPDCEAAPRNLLPGWNERSGWSVLVNGRPIEGKMTVINPDEKEARFLRFAIGPGGQPVDLEQGALVRVTGVVADDAGHGSTTAPEIHPIYAIDIQQLFDQGRLEPVTLSGVWHGSDNCTYYLRQLRNQLWWLGLSRDQGRSFANVFGGVVGVDGRIQGEWLDVPMGAGGVLSGGTLDLEGDQANTQLSTMLHKTGSTANFGAHTWTKIYDTEGTPVGRVGTVGSAD